MTLTSAPITPLDPQSPRGRELEADLTVALDDVEEAIRQRRMQREHEAARARPDQSKT